MSATDSFQPAGRDRRTSKGWVRTIASGRRGVRGPVVVARLRVLRVRVRGAVLRRVPRMTMIPRLMPPRRVRGVRVRGALVWRSLGCVVRVRVIRVGP